MDDTWLMILAIGVLVFLFAGDPDVHDLVMQSLAGECELKPSK